MKKIIYVLLFSVFSFLATSLAYAQTLPMQNDNAGSQRFFCLAAVPGGHDATLSIDPTVYTAIPGVGINVMVRINGSLSTGNPTLDDQLFGNHNGYTNLQNTVGFGNHGAVGLTSTNPVPDVGNFPVTWHDDLDADKASDHFWFGMQIVPPVAKADNGGAGGQQNGTFDWAVLESNKDCNSIRWDPLGYVFDAQTLGLIQGAVVTIYDAGKTPPAMVPVGPLAGQVATNPYPTTNTGNFSFFTEAGKYILTVEGVYNGKQIEMADPSTVNAQYAKAGFTNLYKPGSTIVEEEGQTVRTDIAVKTVGAPALVLPPPVLVDINKIGQGENIQLSGQVLNYTPAAPNAKVVVIYTDPITQQTQKAPIDVALDVNGRFLFKAPQVLESNPDYLISGIDVEALSSAAKTQTFFDKVNSKIASLFNSLFVVHAAQSSAISIDPIPSYLEGITKDANGVILPSAEVGVYLEGNSVPVFKTKSDAQGHYVIGSQFVPPLQYEIRYTTSKGQVIKLSTRDYLKQNAAYFKEKEISPFSLVNATTSFDGTNTLIVTKKEVPQSSSKTTPPSTRTSGNNNKTSHEEKTTAKTMGVTGLGTQGIIILVVAVIILLLVGVGVVVVLKSKQQQPPPMPPMPPMSPPPVIPPTGSV
jgi:hypothetical protein